MAWSRINALKKRQRWRWILASSPLFMLLIIASIQLYTVWAYNLNPWKGGGFGMFSTGDRLSTRLLRVYLETPQGEVPVALVDQILSVEEKIQIVSIPTSTVLEQAAEAVAQARWHIYELDFAQELPESLPPGFKRIFKERRGDTQACSNDDIPVGAERTSLADDMSRVALRQDRATKDYGPSSAEVKHVRIEVWATFLNISTGCIWAEKIRSARIKVAGE